MDKYQIFISYRRDGGDALAGRLADRFNALGYKVFYDVESMRSGTFNKQLFDAILQCDAVLLVLPPNALDRCVNEDDWVRQELSFALKHNKKIIPIMMRGFEFPKTLPADIDNVRNMEGVTASSEYFDAVIERIKSLLDFEPIKQQPLKETETNIKFPLFLKTPDSKLHTIAPQIIRIVREAHCDLFSEEDVGQRLDNAVNVIFKDSALDVAHKTIYLMSLWSIYNYCDYLYKFKPLMYENRLAEMIWLFLELDHPKRSFYDDYHSVRDLLFKCSMLNVASVFYINSASCERREVPCDILKEVSYTVQFLTSLQTNSEMFNDQLGMFFGAVMACAMNVNMDKKKAAKLKKYLLINYKYLNKKNIALSKTTISVIASGIAMCEKYMTME